MQDLTEHGVARYVTWFGVISLLGGERLLTYLAPRITTFLEDHKIDVEKMGMPEYGFY